ncbi:MAG: DUF362 domain-containing protein [Ignavibacteriales bacterium]
MALVKCSEYNIEEVKKAVDTLFELLGGVEQFIKPGMKVLLKPNLIMKKKPEDMVITHPAVLEAVCSKVLSAGGIVTIADSPGGFYTSEILNGIYSASGYKEVAKKLNVVLNMDTSSQEVEFEHGKVSKKLVLIKPALDADFIINLPKLKTHMLMTYTGAVKNLFGLIPGALKADYHIRMKQKEEFANLLVDICECVKPQLNIMDGIYGMEGQGPTSGTPRKIGLLIGSSNPYSLDAAACHIIGLNRNQVPTLKSAFKRNLPSSIKEIDIIGEKIEDCVIMDYNIPEARKDTRMIKNPIAIAILNRIRPKLEFDYNKCIVCKRCIDHCPAKASYFKEGKPMIDSQKCIRCYCCHELCPGHAIEIRQNKILKKIIKH